MGDMDCFNIIDREEWQEAVGDRCLCAVAKAGCEVDKEEGKKVDGSHHTLHALVATKCNP